MLSLGAARLREWRESRRLTQAQVCLMLDGAQQSVYSAFERGARTPKRTVAVLIERITEGLVTVESWDEPLGEAASA
jgi:transcriptional regulator with XRE-family HTH domain